MEVLKTVSGPYRAQPFFTVGVSVDPKNSNSNIIQVHAQTLHKSFIHLLNLLKGYEKTEQYTADFCNICVWK